MNIAASVERNSKFFPDTEAISFQGRSWTYSMLDEEASRAANALAQIGVRRSDKVCLFIGNRPEFIFIYYGCQKIGAVVVAISSLSKADEIEYMVNDSEAVAIITEEKLRNNIPPQNTLPKLKKVISVDAPYGQEDSWSALLKGAEAECRALNANPGDGAVIIYTSGTTGKPKGVVLTHANVISNTTAMKYMWDMRQDDRSLCFLPIYHSFGQNGIIVASVEAGSTIVLMKKFDLEEVIDTFGKAKITRWYAVPAVYIAVLNHPDTARVDKAFKTIRYCFSAAAALPVEILRQWEERFKVKVNVSYGLTETSPASTYNHEYRRKPGSVGTPMMNIEIGIFGQDGQELDAGQTGEIWIRGPNTMKEYYRRPKETAETLVNGYVRTGDIGYLDDEGYLFLVDRLKDMINSSGLKVWPREVEEVIYTHPNVSECSVIGVPNPVYGESILAAIIEKEPGKTAEKEIIDLCKSRLADYKAPHMVKFVSELPKTPTGKILKRVLRDQF